MRGFLLPVRPVSSKLFEGEQKFAEARFANGNSTQGIAQVEYRQVDLARVCIPLSGSFACRL